MPDDHVRAYRAPNRYDATSKYISAASPKNVQTMDIRTRGRAETWRLVCQTWYRLTFKYLTARSKFVGRVGFGDLSGAVVRKNQMREQSPGG